MLRYLSTGTALPLQQVGKIKVKKVRCPATRHGGAWGERRYSSYSYLTSATIWGWVVSVTPRPRFTPGERTPGTHWRGGWVGLRACLDAGARRKILCPCRGSNLDHPIVQPVVRHYTAWATAVPQQVDKYTQYMLLDQYLINWWVPVVKYCVDLKMSWLRSLRGLRSCKSN
jgi:hypothetical protein